MSTQHQLSPTAADKMILRLTIERLERQTWDSPNLRISIENQGELVRAQNRIARRLKEWLRFKEREG